MKRAKQKNKTNLRRQNRTRSRVALSGRPRLTVFRSNKNLYAQIIDDSKGETLAAVSIKGMKAESKDMSAGIAKAFAAGQALGKAAMDKKVKEVVFDRGRYAFHGKVKALADGAKDAGLKI